MRAADELQALQDERKVLFVSALYFFSDVCISL